MWNDSPTKDQTIFFSLSQDLLFTFANIILYIVGGFFHHSHRGYAFIDIHWGESNKKSSGFIIYLNNEKIEIEFEFNENRIFNINVEMKNLTLCQRLKEVELLCQLFG